jgi:hypothetical protein
MMKTIELLLSAVSQAFCRHDFSVVMDFKDRPMNERRIMSYCAKCGKWKTEVMEFEGPVVV